ncbi:helix-turn-helix transcriptional regulator [Pseudomonas sp. ChxA]|uniref:helix-turn-helix domain-containing protein n=1 Tax=Pseudomonas sp. ChxA TaxID=3035473 RepID=UPI00255353CA|nr:helix-turn-helix transcriptional regulator [Pseudomonas sp. ChxA]MDL2187271.1 helix-turn-helix transcriptional regulator [Pseudomonas sp. ChxA]
MTAISYFVDLVMGRRGPLASSQHHAVRLSLELYINTVNAPPMTSKIVDLEQARSEREAEKHESLWQFIHQLPLAFSADHCKRAREILGWSVEALAFRSGASVKAIKDLEDGKQTLRRVTMQALSYAFENEGLIFMPGYAPSRGENCRGATSDPREREDFHLIE